MAIADLTRQQEAALADAAQVESAGIAAGAGAGKTTMLVEAVWRDVENEGIPLDRILVASYNRAAAAHLRARLQDRFADGWGAERVGLDLSAAWVGTFHALAGRIVREEPFAAGVDPEFGELDDVEAATLMEQALDEAIAVVRHPGFAELARNVRTTELLRQAARYCHDRLRAAGHERPRIAGPRDGGAPDPARVAELGALIVRARSHSGVRADHELQLDLAEWMLSKGEAPASAPRLALNCKRAFKEEVAQPFNAAADEVWTGYLEVAATTQLEGFGEYLAVAADRYAQLKRERGALDYEDLLLAARRVLEGGHEHHFARVYVDEYQDANALQERIVDLLGAERTIVVGDGCQAIYGFRHADPAHFRGRVGDPPRIRLTENHRSQEPLLEELNGLLGALLGDEPAFAPLEAAAAPDDEPVPVAERPVELIDVASNDGERTDRAQEAEAVASRVGELIESGYRRRDIVVLFRAMTQVESYRAALERAGIPAHLVAGRGFFEHEQVADTMALLSLVENPHDEPALIRVLASPYVGASDLDLIALRERAGIEAPLWPAVAGDAATRPVGEVVESLRPVLRRSGLAGLVEAATTANDYDLAVLGMADGARRHANLRKLVRIAAAHGSVRGPDLRGFLRLLRTLANAGNQDPGEATLVDPALDAVRLATIHGVKGQEFPVVVLADASHRIPSTRPLVVVDRDGRAGLRLARAGEANAPVLGYGRIADELDDADAAEERRLTYVALTRAERHAAVVGRADAAGKGTVFAALAAAARDADAPPPRTVLVPARGSDGRRARPPLPATTPCPSPEPPSRPPAQPLGRGRLSFTALALFAACSRRFHLEAELGLRGDPARLIGAGVPASAWGGAGFGDLVHLELAEHDWRGPGPLPGWAAARAAALGLLESHEDPPRAERLVAGLIASPLGDRLRGAARVWSERPFALTVDGITIAGSIDLLAEVGDGTALVCDWKTHRLSGRGAYEVADEYALQRDLYALAALRAGYRRVELRWVVLEDIPNSPVWVLESAESAVREAEDALRRAVAALRQPGRRAVAESPEPVCSACPGLAALCPAAR